MTMTRMQRGRRLALACCLAACALPALSQEARPVRLVVPAPPGGSLDATARLFAHRLAALTGEAHVVENRPGANSLIAAELVARAPQDGRTLLVAGGGLALMPFQQKTRFTLDELAAVVQITRENYALVTVAASPVASAGDIAAVAAGRPNGLSCVAPPGPASVACQQLGARMGGAVVHVPYTGVAPALNALLGGHADLMFTNVEAVAGLAATGRVRVLAQSEGAGFAQVPLIGAAWPGLALDGHFGILAPAGTPAGRIHQINAHVNQVLAEPEVRAALTRDNAQQPAGGPPEAYAAALRRTRDRYGEIIQKLGLGPRDN